MLLNFTLLLSNSFASVQDEVMVKSKTKSNVQKKSLELSFTDSAILRDAVLFAFLIY